MKIIKYLFKVPQLAVQDGELVELEDKEEEYYFTLLHRGIGLYKEMTGENLIGAVISVYRENDIEMAKQVLDPVFVLNLAAASYTKIENGKFHNNRATCEEFKKLPVANHLISDTNFIVQLLTMAMDCVAGEIKQNPNAKKEAEKSFSKK